MDTQHLIALLLIVAATGVAMVVATLFRWARDAGFFILVAGAAFTTRMDVNFLSLEWYRGTTRGIEMTGLDIVAIGLFVGCLLTPRYKDLPRWYWPTGLGLLMLYATYCLVSVLVSKPQMFGLFELSKILRGVLFFMTAAIYLRTRRELVVLVTALALVVGYQGFLGLEQRYLYGIHRVTGSIEDPNSLSMYLCMCSPLLLAAALSNFPLWLRGLCALACASAAVGVLLTISRAGIPIFGTVMIGAGVFCVSWKPSLKKAVAVGVIALMGAAALGHAWDMLKTRYGQATLKEEYLEDNEGRGVYLRWASAIIDDHFMGVGLGNWSYWVSKVYGPEAGFKYRDYDDRMTAAEKEGPASALYAAPAHNLAALTAGELGVPGLVIFALVWARWFFMGLGFLWRKTPDPMRRLGVGLFFSTCGIFLQSVTEWTFRQTQIFITFHLLVGALAALRHAKRRAAKLAREQPVLEEAQPDYLELAPETPELVREWR